MSFFSRFNRIVALAYGVIIICATILFTILYKENEKARLNTLQLRLSEQTQGLNFLLRIRSDALRSMQAQMQSFGNVQDIDLARSTLRVRQNKEKGYFWIEPFFQLPDGEKLKNGQITSIGPDTVDSFTDDDWREIFAAHALGPLLKVINMNIKTVKTLHYTSKKGYRHAYPPRLENHITIDPEIREREFFQGALPENNPNREQFWTDAYIKPDKEGLMVTCASPVYFGDEFKGVVAMDFTLESLDFFIASLYYEMGQFIVINDLGTVLADIEERENEHSTIVTIEEILPKNMDFKSIENADDSQLTQEGGFWIYKAKLSHAPWTMIYVVDAWEIMIATLKDVGPSIFLVLLFGMVFLIGANRLIAQEFIKPASELVHHIANQGNTPETIYKNIREPWLSWFRAVSEVFEENKTLVSELESHIHELDTRVANRTKALVEKNEVAQKALNDLKKAQSQIIIQEKLAGLGALTAGISHEIKNPLNFIINFSNISQSIGEDLKEYIDGITNIKREDRQEIDELVGDLTENLTRIEEHGKRADAIVRSMLVHAKGGEDIKNLANLNELVDENIILATTAFKQKGFTPEIITELDEKIQSIKIFRQELGRVILNIINNSLYVLNEKSLKDESFSPLLKIKSQERTDSVEIRIWDNGVGISQKDQKKIFDPFFTTKPTGKGTGLGLSLCYDIVTRQHNGSLTVDSLEGQYTEFIIRLPKS